MGSEGKPGKKAKRTAALYLNTKNDSSVKSIPVSLNSKFTRKSTEAINQGSVETRALPSCTAESNFHLLS